MSYKTIKSTLKSAGLTLAGITLGYLPFAQTAQAETSQESLMRVKQAVKAQRVGYSIYSGAPLDTVDVFKKGGLTITSGKDFTAFEDEGTKQSTFIYDIKNDGKPNVITFTDGKVDDAGRAFIELTGLSGARGGLETELSLSDMELRMKGKTPYTTRRVIVTNYRDSSTTAYDFGSGEMAKTGAEGISLAERLYTGMIGKAKRLLGLQ